MIEILIYTLVGLLLGLVSGIVPGMHVNLVGALALGILPTEGLVSAIVVMLVSSQFFEVIRLVFLLVPEESNVLASHPVYEFVRQGKGIVALKYYSVGLLTAFLIAIIASPLLIAIVPFVITNIRNAVPFILIGVAGYLIFRDSKRFWALGVFICAGIVGWFGLNLMKQPLLILLSGFFALPVLFEAKSFLPKQIVTQRFEIEKPVLARGVIAGFLSSLMLVFLPAIGPSQASVFSRGVLKKTEDFFVAIGAISAFDVIFSIILLYTLGKARIGLLEQFGRIVSVNFNLFVIILAICLFSAIFAYLIVTFCGNFFARIVPKINYGKLSYFLIAFLGLLAFIFDGFVGIGFFVIAGLIGWIANKYTNSMAHCMGSLMIPTLIYLLF